MMSRSRFPFRWAFLVVCFAASMSWRCAHTPIRYSFEMQSLTEADSIFKRRNYADALLKYDNILKKFPRSPAARIALFKIGFINIYYENSQADWSAALKAFRLFQKQFGDDPKIDEVNTWIRILVAMESFAAQYGESSQKIQKLKNKTIEKTGNFEQLREEYQRCMLEKDSLGAEKNTLLQKIKGLEATILKIEGAQ
jgi:outer membrane protein assembly factor BamD (BamD/ComL family)